jgi:nitroreductase
LRIVCAPLANRRHRLAAHDRTLHGMDDAPFDCGAVATALVNAASSRGLGAVIFSQGIMRSPVVREHAGVAEDQVIMKGIALGWPNGTFPANAVVSERKSVAEATVFDRDRAFLPETAAGAGPCYV